MTCRECQKGPAESFETGLCAGCGGRPEPSREERLEALKPLCREYIAGLQAENFRKLSAERDALAAQNRALREALEEIDGYAGGADSVLDDEYVTERRQAALFLPLPAEARAVEALRKIAEWAQTQVPDVGDLCCLCGQLDGHNAGCPALLFDEGASGPALAWLAQQRAEAAGGADA